MTKKILLNAVPRESVESSKLKDFIKVNLYGPGIKNQNLLIKNIELEKAYSLAGESNLIDLIVKDGEMVKVIVKEIQRAVLKNTITHADLYQVDMKKKMTTEIPLHFIGESKAVKELGGILIKSIEHIEVECLPGDLIEKIDVDISVIEDFAHHIILKDLNIPSTLKTHRHDDDVIVSVSEPRTIVEAAPVVVDEKEVGDKKDAKAAVPEKKVEKKGDKK